MGKARVDSVNKFICIFLALCEETVQQGWVHLIEHPRGPRENPYPSIFSTSLFIDSELRMKAERAIGDQCCFGAPVRKTSEYFGAVDGIDFLNVFCPGTSLDHTHIAFERRKLGDDTFQARRFARYPSELFKAIACCCMTSFNRMNSLGIGPSGPGCGVASADKTA